MSSVVDEFDLTAADRFEAPLITPSDSSTLFRLGNALPVFLSFAAHMGLLLGMALFGVGEKPSGGRRLLVASPAAKPIKFQSLPEVDVSVETRFDSTTPVAAVAKVGNVGESLPSPLSVISDRGTRRVGDSALDEVMGLFRGNGHGYGEAGEGQGGAEFFGVRAGGDRFVFVVDSSRSMRGRKWSMACRELVASVKRMGQQQSFYVIFFDVDTHPMFNQKRPERDLLPVTSGNQRKLMRWLPSIKLGPDTRPLNAMQLALKMKPDAIFLLSDGEFNDGTRDYLLGENQKVDDDGKRSAKIPVHTVGFHSLAAEASLKPIAAENGGGYRFVPGR